MTKEPSSDPLWSEPVPTEAPHPGFLPINRDPEKRHSTLYGARMAPYLASRLGQAATVLVRISESRQGGYLDGLDLPETSRAAATGAIATACAALEAAINDFLFLADIAEAGGEKNPQARLIRGMVKLTPLKRYEHLAALFGETVDWATDPAQSLAVLFSVRKHLLHHEGAAYAPGDGFWPSKKLKDLARKIGSPYPISAEAPLSWDQHILTPRGAIWAVNTMRDVLPNIHRWWEELDSSV